MSRPTDPTAAAALDAALLVYEQQIVTLTAQIAAAQATIDAATPQLAVATNNRDVLARQAGRAPREMLSV